MSDHLPFQQAPTAERIALDEWEALLSRLQATGPVDARLARVRHAIASGEFQVDAHAIAARLLAQFLAS